MAWPDLTISQRINALEVEVPAAVSAASKAKMDGLSGHYAAVGADLQTASDSQNGAAGFLNKTFDNAVPGSGAIPLPAPLRPPPGFGVSGKYSLTDDQAGKLAPRLVQAYAGELSDTQVGREALAFMKTPGGEVKLSVVDLKNGSDAVFNTKTGIIKLNKIYVEEAMEKSRTSARELMDESDTESLKKIARYTAPTFVHEYAGHQMHADWARKNGISNYYALSEETGAFTKDALFVLQKQQAELKNGNLRYTAQISEDHLIDARRLKTEGPAGIAKSKMYYEVPSREGVAAKNFRLYESLKKELTLRQLAAKENPEAERERDVQRKDWDKTAAIELEYNSIYPWYKLSLKKIAQDNQYYQEALAALDR